MYLFDAWTSFSGDLFSKLSNAFVCFRITLCLRGGKKKKRGEGGEGRVKG